MDYISLSYVIALANLITFLTMILIWKSNRNTAGVTMWLISATLAFFAFLSIILLPSVGDYHVFVNNTLVITSVLFGIRGILKYREFNESVSIKVVYILLIVFILITSFINKSNPTNRYLILDSLMAILFIIIPFLLLYRQRKDKMVYILIVVFSLIQSTTFLSRFYFALSGDIANYNGTHPVVSYVYFATIAWSFVWTIGILLMIQLKYSEKILYVASFDVLTEIMNRRSFERDLENAFGNSIKNDELGFSLTIIDVDRFKHINDTYGHQSGDEILKFLASSLVLTFPKSNVYRIGGDEFAIINTTDYSINEINQLLEDLQNLSLKTENDLDVQIGFSYGSCECEDGFNNISSLYMKADKQMYLQKKEKDILLKKN